jgi:hypothetical protein
MAHNANQPAKGNAPNTGSPGPTPAPKARVVPQAPDQITFVRKPSPAGYGQNGPQPSSINPGQQMLSPMAANLKASSDDGEGVLDTVIARGTARQDESVTGQLRKIADSADVPPSYGMKLPKSGR